jgi:hypothetical protein
MALALFDRVQETTTTTGTGSVTLGGAVPGFQSFAVVGNGNTCYYTIVDGTAWEVGIGTYSTTGPTLARTTVLSNSSGNTSPITLAAGTKTIFLTYPAEKSVNLDGSNNVSPLGTVSSGVWQGSTVGVAYGGTGVTTSSGANSVMLRDANQNVTINRLNQTSNTITAAGGTTTLTAASAFSQILNGTGSQTFKLPDATTLTNTTTFEFNNNATGTLTITDYANATVGTISSGGAAAIALLSNATVGGTWDVHAYIPENVTWGTNSLVLGSTVITGGTWNGGTIATGYGGTGLTSYTSGGAVYANSSSTLTSGTLPVTAGGTGATTAAGAQSSLNVPSTTGSGASGTWGINITGSASGSAGSVANAVTFNNGGSGDASGITFNGSAARTISYNTIGAPSISGTNATGTWGISVSGNAATATSSPLLSALGSYIWSASTLPTGYNQGIQASFVRSFDGWQNYGSVMNMNTYSGGGGALQMYVPYSPTYGGTGLQVRFGNYDVSSGNSWTAWKTLLASDNYNSYAPTLTGTGATGTWAINITGSATGSLPITGGTLTGDLTIAESGTLPAIYFQSTGVASSLNWEIRSGINGVSNAGFNIRDTTNSANRFYIDYNGNVYNTVSSRAPIFYDSDNTAYYGNFAGTSQFNEATFAGYIGLGGNAPSSRMSGTSGVSIYNASYPAIGFSTASGPDYLIYRLGNAGPLTVWCQSTSETVYFYSTYTQFAGSARAPIFYDSDNTGYYVDPANTSTIRKTNIVALAAGWNDGLNLYSSDGANYWNLLVDSGASNAFRIAYNQSEKFQIQTGGAVVAFNDMRAPIFYDSNDTGYYVNPNGSSQLSAVYADNFFRAQGDTGLYFQNYSYGVATPNATGNAYGNICTYATGKNGWTGYGMGSRITLMTDTNTGGSTTGLHDSNVGWYWRYVYDSYFTVDRGYSVFANSARAPIFYDSDDTNYYVNPNGVSVLSNLLVQNAAVSNNTGGLRNVMPGGGSYATSSSVVSGAIVITLPVTVYPMLRFRVTVYTYDGLSFDIYCGGHNSGGLWYNTFAYMTTQSRPALTVRFCYGSGSMYVYIGDLGSAWSYPQVFITDVQVGYADYSYTYWDDNWSIGFNTSTYNNVSSSHTVYPPASSGNNTNPVYASIYYDANNTGYYVDPASTSNVNQVNLASFLRRNSSAAGYLEGNYPTSIDGNSSACIYTIGGSYQPGATSLGNMYGVGYTVGTGSTNPGLGQGGWGFYVAANGTSRVFLDADNGVGIASASWRAPVFYDRDNTAYYVDPNGRSVISTLNIASSTTIGSAALSIYAGGAGGVGWGTGLNIGDSGNYTTWIQDAGVCRYRNIGTGGYDWYNNTANTRIFYIDNGGYTLVSGSSRAQIFYDSDNTGYYVDPAGSSNFGGDIVRSNITNGNIYLTGSLPGYSANSYPTLKTDSGYLYFSSGGQYSGYWVGLDFVSRGNVTAYSDERHKKDWASVADDFVERLALVKSGTYVRTDTEQRQAGVGAQSLQPLLPEAVLEDDNGLSVAYGNAALVSAIELAKYVTVLEQRISQLEARL